MGSVPFFWVFIAAAGVVDVVGLFYLWRRRNSTVNGNHTAMFSTGQRLALPMAERRRKERRASQRAASA